VCTLLCVSYGGVYFKVSTCVYLLHGKKKCIQNNGYSMHVHVSRRVTDMSDVSATCGPCHVVHTQNCVHVLLFICLCEASLFMIVVVS